ncbi:hypothetical protein GA0061105_12337 [Rhizobium aethiopicum]|uniref:Uncharacterized protein n=1 Tax=Rhizobium aethiopicum TaxID=1138170 RepID=A0A1C3YB84_9HYPH|nr:hypothetical protein GA0061105_12337 [Rhizobium aethiopicum]
MRMSSSCYRVRRTDAAAERVVISAPSLEGGGCNALQNYLVLEIEIADASTEKVKK